MFVFSTAVSIIVTLAFIYFNKVRETPRLNLAVWLSFAFSWVMVALWFLASLETWQIALSMPAPNRAPMPPWGDSVQEFMRHIAFLFPVSRRLLAIFYALPMLLIPAGFSLVKQTSTMPILLYATWINLAFIWLQVLVENQLLHSALRMPLQGVILFVMYGLALRALLGLRPLMKRWSPHS